MRNARSTAIPPPSRLSDRSLAGASTIVSAAPFAGITPRLSRARRHLRPARCQPVGRRLPVVHVDDIVAAPIGASFSDADGRSGEGGGVRQGGEGRVQVGLRELRILEVPRQIRVVGAQVEVAMPAETEQDHALLAGLLAALASSIAARIACAGSGAGMIPSERANVIGRVERLVLPICPRLHEPVLDQRADER